MTPPDGLSPDGHASRAPDGRAMRSLAELPASTARGVDIVLTDIDDTLTTDGRLEAGVFDAMERLRAASIRVVPVTGRPAGWCDHIARMWPVDAVIGENGAFSMRHDRAARRMVVRHFAGEAERTANRERLTRLSRTILREVAGSGLASDQPYRISDLAIDFCEDVAPLPHAKVSRIVELFREEGAQARVSSIHVNGWFGDYDKCTMAQRVLAEDFAIAEAELATRVAFVGDSPNDEPMFAAFPISVGVSNVVDQIDMIAHPPAYVASRRSGAGFIEFVDMLLALTERAQLSCAALGQTG